MNGGICKGISIYLLTIPRAPEIDPTSARKLLLFLHWVRGIQYLAFNWPTISNAYCNSGPFWNNCMFFWLDPISSLLYSLIHLVKYSLPHKLIYYRIHRHWQHKILIHHISFLYFQGTFTLIVEAWHVVEKSTSRSPGKSCKKLLVFNICGSPKCQL